MSLASHRDPLYLSDRIDIRLDERGWLYVDWKGEQTTESMKEGCAQVLHLLRERGLHKVLNDNTHLVGGWSGVVSWVANDWLPRMRAAGLRHFAWVQSESAASRQSANQSAFETIPGTVVLFNEVRSAEVWLRVVDR